MKIHMHAPGVTNEHLESMISKKMDKLSTIYRRIERADVYLKSGDHTLPNAKIVEVRLAVPKNDIFAQEQADSYEKAFAAVVEKLKRQLKKHKAKLSDH